MNSAAIHLAIIAGEESGQLLAADVVAEINKQIETPVMLTGVGGQKLEALGLKSLFDPDEIALTGITAVATTLPRLIARYNQTAEAIIKAKPDCLLLIDSPDFSLRVAKKVKKALPELPIVKYVAPTVWAWRPERARKMRAYVDHILSILPFEPDVFEKLNGPKTTFIGHRLIQDDGLSRAYQTNAVRSPKTGRRINLLVLPGSRKNEIKSLMEPFRETVKILGDRGHDLDITIPTLSRYRQTIRDMSWDWPLDVTITDDPDKQVEAYSSADVALAASGTVTLELALAGVPAISCYKLDPLMKLAQPLITTWSASLPNLIADSPVIREFYNEQIRPGMLARCVEQIVAPDSVTRQSIMDGYNTVRQRMERNTPASFAAAEIILKEMKKSR